MKRLLQALLALLMLISFSTLKAQTLYSGGKMEGSLSTNAHITKTFTEPSYGYQYVAGWFTDSLDIDPGPGTTMCISASGKSAFIAKYNGTALLSYSCISTDADSVIINDITQSDFNSITICGTFNGNINADPFGDGIYLAAPAGGYAGFVVRYDATGLYMDATGTNGYGITGTGNSSFNSIEAIPGPALLIGGHFTGTVNVDNLASVTKTATAGEDAFIMQTDDYFTFNNCHVYASTAGNERVTHVMFNAIGDYRVGGTFSNNITLDFTGASGTQTSAGQNDIFYAKYDAGYNYFNGFRIGNANNEKLIGIGETSVAVLAIEYQGTINMNPLGTAVNLTSTGSTDIAVALYSLLDVAWSRNIGNSGPNKGTYLGVGFDPGGNYQVYVGTTFSGTMDMDPGTPVLNEATTLTPTNAVVIELHYYAGDYVNHYRIEGSAIKGILPQPTVTKQVSIIGEFTGTGVDVLPWDSVLTLTHTGNTALFIEFLERCNFSGENIELMNPYPCFTNEADLIMNFDGGSFPIMNFDWTGDPNQQINANVGSGSYDVFATDFHGCNSDTVSIYLPDHDGYDFYVTAVPTNTTCSTDLGSASVMVNDPIGSVSYLWSNGDTTSTTDSLAVGFYTVNVTDQSGCYVSSTFNISNSDGPVISVADSTLPSCYGSTNGNIDITITGGVAPLSILWSNGATTEDITGVGAGTYSVMVTDANGCQGQMCIDLTDPDYFYSELVSLVQPACGTSTGSLSLDTYGGEAPYSFLWDAAAGSQTSDSAIGLAAGIYTVTVTDNSGCTLTRMFGLSNAAGPWVNVDNIENPSCSIGPGAIYTTSIGTAPISFLWTTGDTGDDLTGLFEGGDYGITVTDGLGCKTATPIYLYQYGPYQPTVCMVTVDSTNTQNVVIWDKTTTAEAVSYNVYREGFCNGGFIKIANVPQDSLSLFYDTVVNTETRSWMYYVTAIDSCGIESDPSVINNTIHLSASYNAPLDAVYLLWDAYNGVELSQYDIYRVDPVDPTVYTLIHSTDAYTLAWNDPANMSVYTAYDPEWYVEAVPLTPCYASRAFNQNASRSNHTRLGMGTIIVDTTGTNDKPAIEDLVRLYPNPTNDRLNIRVSGTDVSYHVAILNQVGQQVHAFDMKNSASISTAALQQGVYYVMMTNDQKQRKVYKLVIAH